MQATGIAPEIQILAPLLIATVFRLNRSGDVRLPGVMKLRLISGFLANWAMNS
jgi:hypothetical protein